MIDIPHSKFYPEIQKPFLTDLYTVTDTLIDPEVQKPFLTDLHIVTDIFVDSNFRNHFLLTYVM